MKLSFLNAALLKRIRQITPPLVLLVILLPSIAESTLYKLN